MKRVVQIIDDLIMLHNQAVVEELWTPLVRFQETPYFFFS
jgi:hypothetical protein